MRVHDRMGLTLILTLAMGLGCATRLVPAQTATPDASGPGRGATATAAAVRVEARSGGWVGNPKRLGRVLTPLYVEVENGSDRDLEIRFDDFSFVGAGDRSWLPRPPFAIEEEEVKVPVESAYNPRGFRVAPYLHGFYPYGRFYDGVFAYDRAYYSQYYAELHDAETHDHHVELPTQDMLDHALAEGVLEKGGRVSGFLYFERIEDGCCRDVTFRFELVDAVTAEHFGRIEIPFLLQ